MIPVVLNGQTGSGKTRLLTELASRGFPVIDLELLANHRGSAFGLLNIRGPQPSQSEFENRINSITDHSDYSQFVFLEYEAGNLGKLRIPKTIFNLYDKGIQILLKSETHRRVQYIMEEYLPADKIALINCLNSLEDRFKHKNNRTVDHADIPSHANDQFSELSKLLETEQYSEFCFRMLNYYDNSDRYNLSIQYDLLLEDQGAIINADCLLTFLISRFMS